jgi:hypothetical protein
MTTSCDVSSENDDRRIVQNVRVSFSALGTGFGKYRVDAEVIPPAGATGIPKATVFVLENGIVRKPFENIFMTEDPLGSREFYVEQIGASPRSGSQYWAEVTVDWMIQQREATTSPVKTQP